MKVIGSEYVSIEFCGQEYQLAANLEVIEAIQEKYASIAGALTAMKNARDLAAIFKMFLDNAVDIYNEDHRCSLEKISIKTIMRRGNYNDISSAVVSAIMVSMTADDDQDEKNGKPGNRRGMVVHHRPLIARLFRKRIPKGDDC